MRQPTSLERLPLVPTSCTVKAFLQTDCWLDVCGQRAPLNQRSHYPSPTPTHSHTLQLCLKSAQHTAIHQTKLQHPTSQLPSNTPKSICAQLFPHICRQSLTCS